MSKGKVETSLDLQVFFHDVLGIPPQKLEELYEFGESKDGYIYAKSRQKAWLNTEEFKKLARALTEIGGEYVRGELTFRLPGPTFKKQSTPVQGAPRETPPTGAPMPVVKQAPPTGAIAPGYYPTFPVTNIISPMFCFRTDIAVDIEELMAEINAAGRIIEPLICKPSVTSPGNVYLGPGERRLLAAKQLGMKTVPVVVDDFSDVEFDKIRLLENVARKDLTDYEVARGLDYMLRTHPKEYPTHEALANDLQKDRTWITHHLKMLELEKANIVSRDTLEKMDEGHAREIMATPEEKRSEVVRRVEEVVKTTGKAPPITEMQEISGRRATAEVPSTSAMSTAVDMPSKPEAPAAQSEFVDIGSFECSECHQKFHVKHVKRNLHRLELVRE